MENNTSNYAKWIPEAGGYVNNGVVVSKTPVYNDAGRLIDLDMSTLNTPGIQSNQENSGTDVNANVTQAGSLGSLATNTGNAEFGTINTPATTSNVAGQTVLSPVDQINKDYEYMVATGNIKGQIDKLTQLSQMTGVDYSQTINDLWNQRSQKIQNEDNAYAQAIAQARQAGDEQLAQELTMKQQLYRDNVGYYDQMGRDLQNGKDMLQVEYETTYMQGIGDITNGIMSQLNSLINFQYNPQMDLRLQVAQGYAVGAVKEQMNHTGMYYSSMTQSAIARAVAELVPVYEQMAREEIQENISLLQNVGNYLMNLEQMQLSIWEAQLNMKIKANAEKRAQINQAIENANARGYYTNEEAILLGVPAGTESHEARIRAEDKQDEIEKEQRSLQNQMTLAQYNKALQAQLMREEYALKAQYATSSGSNGSSGKVTIKTTNDNGDETTLTMDYDEAVARGYISGNGSLSDSNGYETSQAVQNAINEMTSDGNYDDKKTKTFLMSDEFKNMSQLDKADTVSEVSDGYYKGIIETLSDDFSEDYNKTKNAINTAEKKIEEFANIMTDAGVDSMVAKNTIDDLYRTLFTEIKASEEFDYIKGDGFLGFIRSEDKKEADTSNSKAYAEKDIVEAMANSKNTILQELASNGSNEDYLDYQYIKTHGTELYDENHLETASFYGGKSASRRSLHRNRLSSDETTDKISDAQKVSNNLVSLTLPKTKVYVDIPQSVIDESKYNSLEDFANNTSGLEYDKNKKKAFYYKEDNPDIKNYVEKMLNKSGGA